MTARPIWNEIMKLDVVEMEEHDLSFLGQKF